MSSPKRIHVLQHVPFEGPGKIADWAAEQGHDITVTHLYLEEALPLPAEVDFLVIMGVHDKARHPWLEREHCFIQDFLRLERPALGVCLGAQLLAQSLGAKVCRNSDTEIGWWPVFRTPDLPIPWPEEMEPLHWHADTFSLPEGATQLCFSKACGQQAFIWDNRVIGLQFHLEMTRQGLSDLITHARGELVDSPWIQTEETLLAAPEESFERCHRMLNLLLEILCPKAD
jgi:GMP synthase-like glutamine amidotransferase